MCQFGDESKIIKELELNENEVLIGWRNCYITNSFNENEKFLKAVYSEYLYPKNSPAIGNPTKENSEGIYNYNYHYNNYNYYNYNNNYNNNNYYNYNNYNYNNYYYYNYNYYNYNNNNNYYEIQLQTKLWGKVFSYKEGYRSSYCYPTNLVTLDKDSKWFEDLKTIKFANRFNSLIEQLAKEYNCQTIEYSKRNEL